MPKQRIPNLEFILRFFAAVMKEEEMTKAAMALDMDGKDLRRRIVNDPNLQLAKKIADESRKVLGDGLDFGTYILERLSVEARKTWEEIQFWEGNWQKTDAILEGRSKRIRQELFIHALVTSCFDVSTACRATAVSRAVLEQWRSDLSFRQLLDDIHWHKKNFFETALLKLVNEGVPAAVLFVNKTVNRDRGYQEKLEVEHTGAAGGIDIDELDLDLDTRRKILQAVKRKKEQERLEGAKAVVDVRAITQRNNELEAA